MAWAFIMFAYSLAGGVFLLHWGQFIYFVYPEWQIYGGIGMGVAAAAMINILALANIIYLGKSVQIHLAFHPRHLWYPGYPYDRGTSAREAQHSMGVR